MNKSAIFWLALLWASSLWCSKYENNFNARELPIDENLPKSSEIKILSEVFSTKIPKIIDSKFLHFSNWDNLDLKRSFDNCTIERQFNWTYNWNTFYWQENICYSWDFFDHTKIKILDIISGSEIDWCTDISYYRSFEEWVFYRLTNASFYDWAYFYPDKDCSYFK